MEFEQALEAVKGLENGEEVKQAIEAEAKRAKDQEAYWQKEKSKANEEAKGIKQKYKALEEALREAGWDGEVDVNEFVKEIRDTVPDKQKSEYDKQLETMSKQLEDLNKKYKEKEEAERKAVQEQRITRLKQKLDSILTKDGDRKINGKKYVIDGLINEGSVKLNEDGTPVYFGESGEESLEKGLESFLESNPELVVQQAAGAGTSGDNNPKSEKTDSQRFDEIIGSSDPVTQNLRAFS